MKPKLCLGTAQFGLAYGITNVTGKVSEAEVATLLDLADAAGIRLLDTAKSYGNAEVVLGRTMRACHDFRLISKLPAQPHASFSMEDSISWEQDFQFSCSCLGLESLDALLLHSTADLRKPGAKYLEEWLISLRKRGCVQRLGVSIYTAEDLDDVNPVLLDLVQLPLSLYDQRLIQDGTVARLHSQGIAIHARSIYLQGLLLSSTEQWPLWVRPEDLAHHRALEALARDYRCRVIDLALGFAKAQANVEAVVVGLSSISDFTELEDAWCAISPWRMDEWRNWSIRESNILDPRFWPN